MRRKKILVVVAVFAMLFGLAQVAGAYSSYSGPWEATDYQSSTYTISLLGNLTDGWTFGVYDIGDSSDPSSLVLISSSNTYATFNVTGSILDVTQGMSDGSDLSLTSPNDYFGFYFSYGSSTYNGYLYETAGAVNQWLLKIVRPSSSGGPVIASDVAPVPLPSSAIFLFSGFAGLVAFGSRRKIMK